MKIKKGDNVVVIAGKDKGKSGKVIIALPREDKVVVENINMRKKHQKASKNNPSGQIIEKTMPIHVSNVAIADPKDGKPSRIGYKVEGESRVRVAKKSGQTI